MSTLCTFQILCTAEWCLCSCAAALEGETKVTEPNISSIGGTLPAFKLSSTAFNTKSKIILNSGNLLLHTHAQSHTFCTQARPRAWLSTHVSSVFNQTSAIFSRHSAAWCCHSRSCATVGVNEPKDDSESTATKFRHECTHAFRFFPAHLCSCAARSTPRNSVRSVSHWFCAIR